jgi:acetyl-CoA carboxylase carboxyl transferase subunit alpha
VSDLSRKLQELRELAARERVDIAAEIEALSRKIGDTPSADGEAWRRVELARHPDRPTTLEYAQRIFDDFLELHGDRGFGDDSALVGGIGLLGGRPVTFFGHQKGRNMKDNLRRNFGMPHPEGYRKAQRLARQAEKFDRPVLSFIDTPGAFPGVASEERGISQAIAESMKLFAGLRVPVVATVLGEGGSGGAIAIGVADTVLIMENAYYSVITPEGCASILLRDTSKAPESAALLKLTPKDLLGFNVVDRIIGEPNGGAHKDPARAAASLKAAIVESLDALSPKPLDELLEQRRARFLGLGAFSEQEAAERRSVLQWIRDLF